MDSAPRAGGPVEASFCVRWKPELLFELGFNLQQFGL